MSEMGQNVRMCANGVRNYHELGAGRTARSSGIGKGAGAAAGHGGCFARACATSKNVPQNRGNC